MTILLDFDGTLVDQHRNRAFVKLVQSCAIRPLHCRDLRWKQKLAAQLLRDDKRLCAHTIYDRRTLFRLHAEYFPHLSPVTLCKKFWNEVLKTQKVRRGFITLLRKWRDQGHALVCATDTDGPGGNKRLRVGYRKLRLSGFFKKVFIGSEKGVPSKGDPQFVDYMLRKLGVKDESGRRNCVMIGDKVGSDLLPSAAAGISSILIRNRDYKGKWPAEVRKLAELEKAIKSLQVGVFVSYSRKDEYMVAKMEKGLKRTRARFWRDVRDVHTGDRFVPKIADAIRTQKAVLVVLTENSVKAPWVRFEVGQAVYYEITQNKRVFAVLAGKVQNESIPTPLVGLAYIDLRGSKFKAGMQRLRNAINGLS